ncbi:DNA cytosine methyltransferase [Robertmurraya massiliosenegalensis]|uniref:DNA cytosine methyltransferase n=1 Tax=Robertmurraya massiliosenegalensis TaxID=1287657 RepID=UPI000300ADFD|nr:DNA (cytosine-5-)-methyltransferase [Robertmurraya massiliosenegalensis]
MTLSILEKELQDSEENIVKNRIKTQKDINLLSLFSGCGGMDLGFEGGFKVLKDSLNKDINPHWFTKEIDENWSILKQTRFKTVFANDIRPDAKLAWQSFFGKRGISSKTYHLESIVDLVKKYHDEGNNSFPENIDVVTGGFPCQDFSIAGKRQGFNSNKSHTGLLYEASEPSVESRGQLYMWMREVISITKPKVFVAENVKGLVNLGDVKEVIENDFRMIGGNGYLVIPAKVLHAAEYGVPQSRERVIFYGFRKDALNTGTLQELSKDFISDMYDPYPKKTHFLPNDQPNIFAINEEDQRRKFVTVKQAFVDLKEPEESDDLAQRSYSKAKFMGKHCQGQTEVNLSGLGPTIRSEHHGNIEFRRLSEENGGKIGEELSKGMKQRRLTVRECARIQTFPDDYEFVWKKNENTNGLSASSAYKIIGNAVPPLLGYHIAKRLEDNWDLYFKGE